MARRVLPVAVVAVLILVVALGVYALARTLSSRAPKLAVRNDRPDALVAHACDVGEARLAPGVTQDVEKPAECLLCFEWPATGPTQHAVLDPTMLPDGQTLASSRLQGAQGPCSYNAFQTRPTAPGS